MRVIHIADIHWRGLSRHEEYRESFIDFFNQARKLKPDVIYVGGDIVHSKTQGISPEIIDNLIWWFNNLADIAPTHIILGNHDGLMHNKDRQDAITPIINAIENENLYLYKMSGTYPSGVPGFNWCVFSCFDEGNWANVSPVKGDVNIGLYHGAVRGSLTDIDWEIDGEISLSFFDSMDYALLGDIHKRQFLNEKKTIAYSGSTIQQNYGESTGKGFLFWDIKGKDDFEVTFHEVNHTRPFITIDWMGNVKNTVNQIKKHPNLGRYRVRSKQSITQAETKQLQLDIKRLKNATEVVFKSESSFDSNIINTSSGNITRENLRDPKVHIDLIKEYYSDQNLCNDDFSLIESYMSSFLKRIIEKDRCLRNVRWQIDRIKFDNVFAYGNKNLINFKSIPGITGIFGKNAKGKSSIIGAITYGLFNSTDRGSLKNIHIINNRKNSCSVEIDLSINGKKYRVKRGTVKNQTRKGDSWAATQLKIYRLSSSGEIIEDISGEQRRDTELLLRNLIGNPDDFLMTSLSAQGYINSFIKEKATARKQILSNFLDLGVFDKIHELVKNDSQDIRSKIKNVVETDWDAQIDDLKYAFQNEELKLKNTQYEIESLRSESKKLNIDLIKQGDFKIIAPHEIKEQKNKIENIKKEINDLKIEYSKIENEIDTLNEKFIKIENIKRDFPIEDLEKKLKLLNDLEKNLISIENDYNNQKNELARQKKSVKKLLDVPCGDKFPLCKFIKDSHKNKNKIESQEKKVTSLLISLSDIKDAFKQLVDENVQEKIDKYNEVLKKQNDYALSTSRKKINLESAHRNMEKYNEIKNKEIDIFEDMKLRESNDKNCWAVKIKKKIHENDIKIMNLDQQKTKIIKDSERLKFEIERLTDEKKNFEKIKKELRIYDMIMQAVSKKGIPLHIMMDQLPRINAEILKILRGVVGFTVELEADHESNSMDIYINYGDSKRIAELGSGMEKMMASLAIRVALINVSSLPKTNILIIDEGFGALDETNLEACGRLLNSLKKWFRNILIISHVDAIKDCVDNTIDILKNGKDAKVYYE